MGREGLSVNNEDSGSVFGIVLDFEATKTLEYDCKITFSQMWKERKSSAFNELLLGFCWLDIEGWRMKLSRSNLLRSLGLVYNTMYIHNLHCCHSSVIPS